MYKSVCGFLMILILLSIFLFSCGDAAYDNLKVEVNEKVTKMTNEFQTAIDMTNWLNKLVIDTLSRTDLDTIDISKMDEKDGGKYHTFQDKMYIKRFNPSNLNEMNSGILGAGPITDLKKKKLMAFDLQEQAILDMSKKSQYVYGFAFVGNGNEDISFGVPRYDIASVIPAGLDFGIFPWFNEAIEKGRDKVNVADPLISMAGVGISVGFSTGTYINGKGIGYSGVDLNLLKLADDLVKDSKNMVFLAFKDSNVFGASKAAKDNLKIKVMKDFDYTEQLKANPKFSDEFRLNYEKQSPDLVKLAELIKSENSEKDGLTIMINNKKYKVFISEVVPYGYFIVGLK